ncbi:Monooxygenase aurF [Cladobotryum mycophilum]|uniref:Monooxygenase aurF n=1 Tax=Cladobotryum mycophilum TaxID=491253 RepID=A0ABR0SRE5_9HYPO
MASKIKVAVVGLGDIPHHAPPINPITKEISSTTGINGLATVKNLVEAGMDVTGFDSSDSIGGLWCYTEDPRTSMCYTDFPHAEATSIFPTNSEVLDYLKSYAAHFRLESCFRLQSRVSAIKRLDDRNGWELTITDSRSSETTIENFDKVVMCMGNTDTPIRPEFDGLCQFKGTVLDCQTCKRTQDWKNQRILLIGLGGTSIDIADGLVTGGNKVFISHRRGGLMVPRIFNGRTYDSSQKYSSSEAMGKFPPAQASIMVSKAMTQLQNMAYDVRPEWKLSPAPPMFSKAPFVGDELYPHLKSGAVELVSGVSSIEEDGKSIKLNDERILESIDAIIFCAGYRTDYTLLGPWDPSRDNHRHSSLPGLDGQCLPRLYQGIFSLDAPQSLAFLEVYPFSVSTNINADLASMALAQVWAGKSTLPPLEEMIRSTDEDVQLVLDWAQKGPVRPHFRNGWEWGVWCSRMAGTGLMERLSGTSWKAWWFWLWKRRQYNILRDGFWSPHHFRVFDEGKRKPWDGAMAEIGRLNQTLHE